MLNLMLNIQNSYYVIFIFFLFVLVLIFKSSYMKLTVSEFKRKADYFLTFPKLWYLFSKCSDKKKEVYQVDILFKDGKRFTTYENIIARFNYGIPLKSIYFSVVDDFSYSVSLKYFRSFLISCNTPQLKKFLLYQFDLFKLYPSVYNSFLDFVKLSVGEKAFEATGVKPFVIKDYDDLPF